MNLKEEKSILAKIKILENTVAKYRYASHNEKDKEKSLKLLEKMVKIQEQIKELKQKTKQ